MKINMGKMVKSISYFSYDVIHADDLKRQCQWERQIP